MRSDAGAAEIYLVGDVEEALSFKAAHPGTIALGENRGLRPEGFDYPNSPAMVSRVDLTGRTLVQRTSAGTRGVVGSDGRRPAVGGEPGVRLGDGSSGQLQRDSASRRT